MNKTNAKLYLISYKEQRVISYLNYDSKFGVRKMIITESTTHDNSHEYDLIYTIDNTNGQYVYSCHNQTFNNIIIMNDI